MREFIIVEDSRHQALLSQRDSNTRGVASDPSAAPLFSDICGGSGTTSRIEHEVTGISGNQNASAQNFGRGLHNVDRIGSPSNAIPPVGKLFVAKIVKIPLVIKVPATRSKTICPFQTVNSRR